MKVEALIKRPNGSEARITATEMFGAGLHRSVDVYVHHRESPEHPWKLANDRPHPDWRAMSVQEYIERGRAEKFQVVSHGEIFKTVAELNRLSAAAEQSDRAGERASDSRAVERPRA